MRVLVCIVIIFQFAVSIAFGAEAPPSRKLMLGSWPEQIAIHGAVGYALLSGTSELLEFDVTNFKIINRYRIPVQKPEGYTGFLGVYRMALSGTDIFITLTSVDPNPSGYDNLIVPLLLRFDTIKKTFNTAVARNSDGLIDEYSAQGVVIAQSGRLFFSLSNYFYTNNGIDFGRGSFSGYDVTSRKVLNSSEMNSDHLNPLAVYELKSGLLGVLSGRPGKEEGKLTLIDEGSIVVPGSSIDRAIEGEFVFDGYASQLVYDSLSDNVFVCDANDSGMIFYGSLTSKIEKLMTFIYNEDSACGDVLAVNNRLYITDTIENAVWILNYNPKNIQNSLEKNCKLQLNSNAGFPVQLELVNGRNGISLVVLQADGSLGGLVEYPINSSTGVPLGCI